MDDKSRPRREPREILNEISWIARSGAAWRDLPERYGSWQTVYKRFKGWSECGLIENIFHELGEDADLQEISIDSAYIKAHKASAGANHGAERGGSKPVSGEPSTQKEVFCEDKTQVLYKSGLTNKSASERAEARSLWKKRAGEGKRKEPLNCPPA